MRFGMDGGVSSGDVVARYASVYDMGRIDVVCDSVGVEYVGSDSFGGVVGCVE